MNGEGGKKVPRPHAGRFIWWMQTEQQVAANPQTKSTTLGSRAVSPLVGCYHLHPPLPFIITQLENWYSFTIPQNVEGCWHNYYSKGVQPVSKAVYHSGCSDKHNCSVVRTVYYNSSGFEVKVGMHQGSALSPLLSVIVMEATSREFGFTLGAVVCWWRGCDSWNWGGFN